MTTAKTATEACRAITKAGKPCRSRATAGDTCRRHAPAPLPEGACGAVNADGSLCRRPGIASDGRCNLHTEATHTVVIRYTCGHTGSRQRKGDRPSGFDMLGGDLTETPEGWVQTDKHFACGDCRATEQQEGDRARAACAHARRHIQDGDIVCADCHCYLGSTDVPVEMTPAQAQAVYAAPYREPVCPAHTPWLKDCECHSCMAQVCDCAAAAAADADLTCDQQRTPEAAAAPPTSTLECPATGFYHRWRLQTRRRPADCADCGATRCAGYVWETGAPGSQRCRLPSTATLPDCDGVPTPSCPAHAADPGGTRC